MSTDPDPLELGSAALAAGRWADARAAFEAALSRDDSAAARFGLANALWWQGENHACVAECERAYARFREAGDLEHAVQCAVFLAITYKANFANFAAAHGWMQRAERLLAPLEPGPLHGWLHVARAYKMDDLERAEALTAQALHLAHGSGDTDLELVALSQLGLVRVGRGDTDAGFSLIDEAVAAALAGERSSLDTVVYACCDLLNACEIASDLSRAVQWCEVADRFVTTYGCPFLYAECRICYGSVLARHGRWEDAERELEAGLRVTAGACPALHARATARLAVLRLRQGRVEDADRLLAALETEVEADAETALSVAALLLARGDAPAASRRLAERLDHLGHDHRQLASALDLLVDARLAEGDAEAAHDAAQRLARTVAGSACEDLAALALAARGRAAAARSDPQAETVLEDALGAWARAGLPYETARTRADLARAVATRDPARAVDHARQALAAFEALGAARDADRVAAFLRSLGVHARTGPKGLPVLTAREREVLELLGAGLSNPEIARRLHVSRKTAAHHVSNILTKLGVRNRTEAAAYAARAFASQQPTE